MTLNPASTLRRHRSTFVVVLVLCAGLFVGAGVMQARDLTSEQMHAQSRTRAIANEIDGRLDIVSLEAPLDAATVAALDTRLSHALADEDVMAVRVWTPGGTLRYSSLPHDRSGPLTEALSASTKGLGRLNSIVDGEVMTTYAPLRAGANGAPFGAVEIQEPYGPVLAAASQPWSSIRPLAASAGAVMVIVLAWGLLGGLPAKRAAREGAGFGGRARSGGNPDSGEDHREELEAAWASLEEADAAREVAEHEWARAQAHSEELERQLALERVDATGAGERLVHARERIAELEALGEGTDAAPAPDASNDGRIAGLEAALEAALERARSAEDLAAAFQDRLSRIGAEDALASAWSQPVDAAETTELLEAEADDEASGPEEDEAGVTGLRRRLARTAARRRARRREEDEWP